MIATLDQEIPVESAFRSSVFIGGRRTRKLRSSNSRLTVRWKDCIVKVGDQGAFEVERWNKVRPDDARHFAPIVASGMLHWEHHDTTGSAWPYTSWVAQRFIPIRRTFPFSRTDEIEQAFCELQAVTARYGIVDIDLVRAPKCMFAHNWTICQGVPMVYDYGF